ncbi:MAG: DUF177 domain-containing protein [Oscillospiraceae bacterium]|jgi:uncharacterized protein|nr:DUF177 domain-containing protein [Oscillospiraceae bacterium]
MILDLREMIGVPGLQVRFEDSPDLSGLKSESVLDIIGEPAARGVVRNDAGLLTMRVEIEAKLLCACSRCTKEFERDISCELTASLSESETAQEDPEYYYIEGTTLDTDEIIVTELILSAEQRTLCREDCRGLCDICGSDLNEGDCSCKPEVDPRLAVLGRLLDE